MSVLSTNHKKKLYDQVDRFGSRLVRMLIMKTGMKPAFVICEHLTTYKEKAFVRLKCYRRRLGCLKVIMRRITFAVTRMFSYQTKDPRRKEGLRRRYSRDPELGEWYRTVIKEYVAKGYARKLTQKKRPL